MGRAVPNLRAGKRELLKLPILDLRERAIAPLEVSLHQEADFQGHRCVKTLPAGQVSVAKKTLILILTGLSFADFS
jgi:hypothetical protein